MKLLIDTHVLIWFITGDTRLPEKSIKQIKNLNTKCFVSIASIWEITIKISLGKLEINGGLNELSKLMKRFDIEVLPITFEHLQVLIDLEFLHRDPFDRIIVSQGIAEELTIITIDEYIPKYKVKTMWK
ncbi:MAG: twitching motility protein PilT [Bacteroidetes bacterium GWC2_40_13]|jgi:PIN domain nuclease of toxin-antitoxin system|nr:MAG: twitching motility protein PilT [Bacteroidetes bacterium GWC2_40_13]